MSVIRLLTNFLKPTSNVRATAVKMSLIQQPQRDEDFHRQLCVRTWSVIREAWFSFLPSLPSEFSFLLSAALQVAKNCCVSVPCRGMMRRKKSLSLCQDCAHVTQALGQLTLESVPKLHPPINTKSSEGQAWKKPGIGSLLRGLLKPLKSLVLHWLPAG